MSSPSPFCESNYFRAPSSADVVDQLIARYRRERERIHEIYDFVVGEDRSSAMSYFLGADGDREQRYIRQVDEVFDLKAALDYLDAVFWQCALNETDVYECMPQSRKDEWNRAIRDRETPEFTEETVRSTLEDLLLRRRTFVAEKVDGVFRRLSGEHVTNRPEGFFKRFIMNGCFMDSSFANSSADLSASGYLNDLREVVAKFVGRDAPMRLQSARVMELARNRYRGEWLEIDGWAMKIRCYKKGTMHIEVHPDVAWRLNRLLHELHPAAIPASHRTPPKRRPNIPPVHNSPIPFEVLRVLADGAVRDRSWEVPFGARSNLATLRQAESVLAAIGGVKNGDEWQFDYSPRTVLDEIQASGVIPDRMSHQFYPTPDKVAAAALELAGIEPGHRCLEPSAGHGDLAFPMQESAGGECVDAVEVSRLHCKILKARGACRVHCEDFLSYSPQCRYDRIVMNPPYSQGRSEVHLERALGMLAPGGRLVAVLPASHQQRSMPGDGYWADCFDNAFAGTSMRVALYVVDAPDGD